MGLLEAPGFGRIVVRGREVYYDVVLCKDMEFPRLKELSSDRRDVYGHTPLTLREIREYLSRCGSVEEVVIACGYYGDLPIEPDAISYAAKRCRRITIVKTGDLPELSIDLEKTLVVIHVTC